MKSYDTEHTKPTNVEEPDFTYGGYTAKDYLKWTVEGMMELIEGFAVKLSAPKLKHQNINGLIYYQFIAQLSSSTCKCFIAPLDVYLPEPNQDCYDTKNVLQPDLVVVCDQKKLFDGGICGAPDLVVEVLSKSTAKRDLQTKYAIYEHHGVKEYWIVDPVHCCVTPHVLQPNGKFIAQPIQTDEDELTPTLFPNITINLAPVFEDPLG